MLKKVKDFLSHNMRVLKISTKPTMTDFKSASKVTGLGIVVIGTIGFLIYLLFILLGLFQTV